MRVGSRLVAALEVLWDDIAAEEPAVPRNVVIMLSFASGQTVASFDPHVWKDSKLPYHEVLVDPRAARWGHGALEVLLHEAAHGRALTFGERDTSKTGYHNLIFARHAKAMGLEVTKDRRPSIGWRSDLGSIQDRWREPLNRFHAATRELPYRMGT